MTPAARAGAAIKKRISMRVLAIDTALGACSVAVFESDAGIFLARESLPMARGHAEALMPLVARVMDAAGIEFADLHRVAVTVGPGSFTGLRVGIAAARGIGLAASKPVVGVSTLAAFAAPSIAISRASTVVTAVDARHGRVFLQVFGSAGGTLDGPRLAPIAEAARPADGIVHVVGSAADLVAAAWPSEGPPPTLVEAEAAPDIEWVARLGVRADPQHAPPRPLYLRPPDAQPQDAARLPRR
jgi:tRNA threonylcarbamoyladenosine biosynthesis protein TsaB